MGWREDIGELPTEQRQLIEGGELSQRFAKKPLGMTHPALIGGFYGFLVAMSLMLPIGYTNGWNQDTLRPLPTRCIEVTSNGVVRKGKWNQNQNKCRNSVARKK